MTLSEIVTEIKVDFKSYYSTGLLDDVSMERWGLQALKMFGKSVMTLHEAIVDVSCGQGELPLNFFALYAAYECTPINYSKVKTTKALQGVRQWKETNEKIKRFDTCNECCSCEEERVITEKIYFEADEYQFNYKPMGLLSLGKYRNKSAIAEECRNKHVHTNPKEIMIKNDIVFTNYPEGTIYMQYFGLEETDEGDIEIPDSSRGAVAKYVEDYIKYKVVEKIVLNQDDTNLVNLMGLLKANMQESYSLAKADVNFDCLTPESFRKLKMLNTRDLQAYSSPIENIKTW